MGGDKLGQGKLEEEILGQNHKVKEERLTHKITGKG